MVSLMCTTSSSLSKLCNHKYKSKFSYFTDTAQYVQMVQKVYMLTTLFIIPDLRVRDVLTKDSILRDISHTPGI